MTYDLYIGDRTFSSWSLRGWLMMEKFKLPFRTNMVGLYDGTMAEDLEPLAPARLVPIIKTPDGQIIGESLAIAETLAERHPEAGFWPEDARMRARARWLCAEMASGFFALRNACPMQLQHVTTGVEPSADVRADLARIDTIWAGARALSGSEDGWLFGSYSLADVFFAPVAARIIGYDLSVSDSMQGYCKTTIEDDAFKKWRQEGLKKTYDPFPYPSPGTPRPWPS